MSTIGLFILIGLLHIIQSLLFAIPAGFGLAAGFYLFKRIKSARYRKKREQAAVLEAQAEA